MTSPTLTRPSASGRFLANLSARGLDGTTLLALPAVAIIAAIFVYPFLYGLILSFRPKVGGLLANYIGFFSDPFLYDTIWTTILLSVPVTFLNVAISVPIALRVRLMRHQRLLTTILVVPITLGTVLVAQGLLNYLGPQGWFNRTLMAIGLIHSPVRLLHNYWGVFLSLLITGFPFSFLLTLSYLSGHRPGPRGAPQPTLGASASQRFWNILLPLILPGLAITFCLSFVQAFSVFPSAILLGAPAGPHPRHLHRPPTRPAFEQYDYSMASAIAMLMGVIELGIVAAVLAARGLFYRGPASGGKG